MGPRLWASSLLASDGLQPFLVADEFLAGRAPPGSRGLGLLDLAPVVIVGRHHAPTFEQALEARRAGAISGAARGHGRGDLVGDFIAVGAVGADRPGRPAPRPADRVKPVGDAAVLVDELAA